MTTKQLRETMRDIENMFVAIDALIARVELLERQLDTEQKAHNETIDLLNQQLKHG